MFEKIGKYISEVRAEMGKVSWPGREEIYGSVLVVLVLCLALSFFVFGTDFLLNRLLDVVF
jgi:preprotein translocase subunit SecE